MDEKQFKEKLDRIREDMKGIKGYRITEYIDEAGNVTFSYHCYKADTGELVRDASFEE